jgi:hypothetical protein
MTEMKAAALKSESVRKRMSDLIDSSHLSSLMMVES